MKNININLKEVAVKLNGFETRAGSGLLTLEWGFYDVDKAPVRRVKTIKKAFWDNETVTYDLNNPSDDVAGFMGVVEHPETRSYIKLELVSAQEPLFPETMLGKVIDITKKLENMTNPIKSIAEYLWEPLELGKKKSRIIGHGLAVISAQDFPQKCKGAFPIEFHATEYMQENAMPDPAKTPGEHYYPAGEQIVKKGQVNGSVTLHLSSLT